MLRAAAIPPQPLRGYLAGMTLSRASATTVSVAAGFATDSTNAASLNLTSAITKSTAGTWVAGTGQNGMGTGVTVGNSTWYHVFAIINAGAVDVYLDTSVTAANKPTNTTAFRRIGSVKTDGSAQILAFTQDGDYFRWSASISEFADTNPGTSAVTKALTGVPTGVNVFSMLNLELTDNSQANAVYVSDPAASDEAATQSGAPLGTLQLSNIAAAYSVGGQFDVRTDTSAQIRYRCLASGAATVVRAVTLGWLDSRGRT